MGCYAETTQGKQGKERLALKEGILGGITGVGPKEMMIKIKRDSGYVDRLRAYKVVVDGNVVGEIKNGQQIELDVSQGKHELFLKIDWCRSNVVEFESDGSSDIEFECGSNLRGLKILLSIVYVTFLRSKYIWLKKKI